VNCTNELCELHDPDECDDETEPCSDCYIAQLESENEQLKERAMELFKQDIALAAQRRTIATLRARLQNRKGGYWSRGKQQEEWITGWRNRYDALQYGNGYLIFAFNGYSSREAKAIHRKRIAAIRNFGALP
jgi:hypothetical protein